MKKNQIQKLVFTFLILLQIFAGKAFSNDIINNPYNAFYPQFYVQCGKTEITVKWHLCSQFETIKQTNQFIRENNVKTLDQVKYLRALKPFYYEIILLVSQYEKKQITLSYLTGEILEIADEIRGDIDENMLINHKIKDFRNSKFKK